MAQHLKPTDQNKKTESGNALRNRISSWKEIVAGGKRFGSKKAAVLKAQADAPSAERESELSEGWPEETTETEFLFSEAESYDPDLDAWLAESLADEDFSDVLSGDGLEVESDAAISAETAQEKITAATMPEINLDSSVLYEENATEAGAADDSWLDALLSDDSLTEPEEETDTQEAGYSVATKSDAAVPRHTKKKERVSGNKALQGLVQSVRSAGSSFTETTEKSETFQKLKRSLRKGKAEKANTASAVMRASAAFNGEEYVPPAEPIAEHQRSSVENRTAELLGRFSGAIPIQKLSRQELNEEADEAAPVLAENDAETAALADNPFTDDRSSGQSEDEKDIEMFSAETSVSISPSKEEKSTVEPEERQSVAAADSLDDIPKKEEKSLTGQHTAREEKKTATDSNTWRKKKDGITASIHQLLSGREAKGRAAVQNASAGSVDVQSLTVDVVCCAVALLLIVFTAIVHPVRLTENILYLLALALTGYAVILQAVRNLQNRHFLSDAVLCCAASLISLSIGNFGAAAVIMLCRRVVSIAASYTAYKNSETLADITALLPTGATLEVGGSLRYVSLKTLHCGDMIRVEPGETIAADGVVTQGISEIDISPIAGEAMPVRARAGTKVYAGTINRTSPLRIMVMEEVGTSFADRFIAAAKASAGGKAALLRRAEVSAKYCTPAFVALGLLLLLIRAVAQENITGGFSAMAICLLLAAMGEMSTTVAQAYVTGIYDSAKRGVLFRQSFLVSAMSKVKTLVTTMTGVLTDAEFKVTEVHPISGLKEGQLLSIAAAAEAKSGHPIAKAIRAADISDNEALISNIEISESSGRGLTAFVGNHHVSVGNALHIAVDNLHTADARFVNYNGNLVHVAVDGRYCGGILIRDSIRPKAFEALDDMRLNGIRSFDLLTGAVRGVARSVASALNFDMVKSELTSEEKQAAFAYLMSGKEDGAKLAFIGDYSTDAEMLDRADVGIAHNVLGDIKAMENADVCMLGTDLSSISDAFGYALQAERSALVALTTNLGARAVVFLLLLLDILPIGLAAILLFGVELLAWINNGIRINLAPVKEVFTRIGSWRRHRRK